MKKNKLHPIAARHGYESNEAFYKDFPDEASYLKKYKLGGEITGEETRVVSAGTAYSNNNQLPGNTGATSLEDPYSFATKMGVTTLTPQQWKKLDAGQQQAIWRQGFEKAGFTQIGANSFTSNGQPNKFRYGGALPSYNIGGSIGSSLGQALQFIPGVGPIVSSIATPLLTEAGNALAGELGKTKIPVAKEVAKTINPTGTFRYGGNIPQYKAGGKPTGGEDGYVQPKEVYEYLLSKGVSREHALGMLANMRYESSFNPSAYTIDSNNKPSGGLFQHNGPRYEAMVKHAGDDWATDWKAQVDYALSEEDTKKYTAQKFRNAQEASMWFTKNWERPADAELKAQERIAALNDFTFANGDNTTSNGDNTTFIDGAQGRINVVGSQATKESADPMILKYKDKINALNSSIKKYGGQVAQNVVATAGGKFEDLGGNILLAKGNLHSQGGIKLDTNSSGGFDGVADIEVEDGEPIITDAGDTGYVINRDVAKPYLKLLKSLSERHDKVSETGRNLIKQEMIKKNEVLKASKGESTEATTKFVTGGLLSGLSSAVREYDGAPYAASFYNPFGGSSDVIGPVAGGGINRPTVGMGSARTIDANTNMETGLNMPKGDMLQLAGMAIPTLYNLGRGLFDKAEVVDPAYNPYEGKALSTLASRTYNPQAIQNQLDRTFTAGRQDINNMTSSAGTRLGNIQNLYSNLGQQRAMVDVQGQQMNNQYKADYASALDNFGRQRQAAEVGADEYNWANRVAKDQFLSEGVSNLGQSLTAFGQQKNTAAMNAVGLKILNDSFPNYYFDAGTINQIISGVKPSWMKDTEFEQAKILLYRSGFKG